MEEDWEFWDALLSDDENDSKGKDKQGQDTMDTNSESEDEQPATADDVSKSLICVLKCNYSCRELWRLNSYQET